MFLSVFRHLQDRCRPLLVRHDGPRCSPPRLLLDALPHDGSGPHPGSAPRPGSRRASTAASPSPARPRHRPRRDSRPARPSSPTPSADGPAPPRRPPQGPGGSASPASAPRLRPRQGRGLRLRPPPRPCQRHGPEAPSTPPATCHLTETYYSIGGGCVATGRQLRTKSDQGGDAQVTRPHPSPQPPRCSPWARPPGLSIAAMKRASRPPAASPARRRPRPPLACDGRLHRPRSRAPTASCPAASGPPPGGRRSHGSLLARRGNNLAQPHTVNDWLSVYAMAVSGRTPPAAGRHRADQRRRRRRAAVVRYYRDHCIGATRQHPRFPADRRGGRQHHQTNASISSAEVGCWARSAPPPRWPPQDSAPRSAGTNAQVENAAEIALEHHLGMTCDPVKGLVRCPASSATASARSRPSPPPAWRSGATGSCHAARRLHRDYAPDQPRHERQV